MVALQIRDVPDSIRDDLAREAAARSISLQTLLREIVDREAKAARNRSFLRTLTPVPASDISAETIIAQIAEQRRERDERVAAASGPDPS